MYGDFSRLTFDPGKGFSAVLMQQGRVQLDQDSNENTAILLHYLRALAEDLIGAHGGPKDHSAFLNLWNNTMARMDEDIPFSPGRYYVHGLQVEVKDLMTYYGQPYAYLDKERVEDLLPTPPYVIYLKVWERSVLAVEEPSIREKALGIYGPDTAARARLVWQLIAAKRWPGMDADLDVMTKENVLTKWNEIVPILRQMPSLARLSAKVTRPKEAEDDPCVLDPLAGYRGRENHLYRVEVHSGGVLGEEGESWYKPTFKWSRDNGTAIFPILDMKGREVWLAHLGRDETCNLHKDDWVEIVDDAYSHRGQPSALRQVKEVDEDQKSVVLDDIPAGKTGGDPALHPYLRRWDQRPELVGSKEERAAGALVRENDNAARITAADGENEGWLNLEHGLKVKFSRGEYRHGDYWLIAARVIDGSIEWPQDVQGRPALQAPYGIHYHYAPITLIKSPTEFEDLREEFPTLVEFKTHRHSP